MDSSWRAKNAVKTYLNELTKINNDGLLIDEGVDIDRTGIVRVEVINVGSGLIECMTIFGPNTNALPEKISWDKGELRRQSGMVYITCAYNCRCNAWQVEKDDLPTTIPYSETADFFTELCAHFEHIFPLC